MATKVFLLTPPFTQLNTPYPATAYLKGFLNTKNISSYQADLGIEVILKLFSSPGLEDLFNQIIYTDTISENSRRIIALKAHYINTIDAVTSFLQGHNPTLSHLICQEDFLPEASRFSQLEDIDWAFGTMGTQDKAKHLATLYLEDISDLIVECIDPHFGFSRYAERMGRSASSFDELYAALQLDNTYIDGILLRILEESITKLKPELVSLSVPFPGNLYSAFRIAQWLKLHYPGVKVAMGGGFPNTELRSVSDVRVFEFFDFICLDDGEAPMEHLCEYLDGKRGLNELKRTFAIVDSKLKYCNGSICPDYKQVDVGTPDYSDLLLDKYISVIEVVNPMHRMWSDGRWNKLTMAHGCYWGKCTFCDISLDYIKVYEPVAAGLLCDRMEEMIAQTGERGFHFVDEAAPPALMRSLALEIIRRKLTVTWWTNIRFEKSFTRNLCLLLKASGCIAISGGLEVASDRLLELIQKGVTVEQVARVCHNFTEAGIMVHAYLMYGFPTQSAQETIDSLEMVRQMFESGVLQSAFWHQFAMTAHSPVGMYPEKFKAEKACSTSGSFANNDIVHIDKSGTDHELFSYGLKKSLFNYMHGICFDYPLQEWFEHKVPKTKVDPEFIIKSLSKEESFLLKPDAKIVWLGTKPVIDYFTKSKKGRQWEMAGLKFFEKKGSFSIQVEIDQADWLIKFLTLAGPENAELMTFKKAKMDFETYLEVDFEPFWYGKAINSLRQKGLLVL
ncbi:radical SAM protein [Daejeonella sp.]|uniref:B12-binding domain-containing radical SAM protein n=1 Tax=Daejeonella sp. TaxID=2805397 RepID=UPI00272F282D|nr:B12-binding domain-containing radical SAM protein [Daejeonella sp.]MDP2414430.1 B12-binding domain-containing radical SAM protein [Daejeonella sp.]